MGAVASAARDAGAWKVYGHVRRSHYEALGLVEAPVVRVGTRNPRKPGLVQRCGHLRRDLIHNLSGRYSSPLVSSIRRSRHQVRQAALNSSLSREPVERGDSSVQGLVPVRGRNAAAPEALHDVPNLN